MSRDDEDFPEDTDKVLNAVTKTSYPTEDQLKKETGLSVGRVRRALRHLENSNLIREQVGSIHGTMYKLVSLDPKAPAEKRNVRGDSRKTLELMTKVKDLYEVGKSYAEIAKDLKVADHKVSYLCSKLIKSGQVERRYLAPHITISEPKSTEVEIPIIITNENEDEEESDEPKVLSCPKCDFVTKSYAGLHIHIGQKHKTAATVKQKLKAKKNEHAPDPPVKSEPLVTITLTMGEALETGIALALADRIDEKRFEESHRISDKVLQALVDQIARENHLGAS